MVVMSSSETEENTENYSLTLEKSAIDDKLAKLSCPFTWGMKDVIQNRNKLLDSNENRLETVADIQDNFPEFIFIYHVMLAYENFMCNDLPGAEKSIDSAEESLADVKKKAILRSVEDVLEHIFIATKCHLLQKLERIAEVDELLDEICIVDDMNKGQLAMLNGCQCLAWMLYYATDNLKAIKHAEKAIEYESDNGKWYFLLGKNYRRLRRRHNSVGLRPSPPESSAYEKAFSLSENVLFGVSLAQMYRESLNYPVANMIYKKVYDLQPTCCKVRLQLALGFIRAKQCQLAKDCLDYVAENMPSTKIYSHYMGIYEEKCNRDFKAALSHYKSTTENCNAVAEWQYVECRKKVEPDWDPLPYLLSLLMKYDKDTNHIIQGINIQIGAYYLFEKHDLPSACPYLIKAISISPNAKILKDHQLLFRIRESVNIYHALTKEIQFALKNSANTKYDDDEIAVLKDALQHCHKNCKDPPSLSASSREQTSSSQSSQGYRNYDRGLSSRAGVRITRDGPSASSRGFRQNDTHQSSNDVRNLSRGFAGSYRDTRRGSDERASRDNWRRYDSPNTFKNSEDSDFRNSRRGRGSQQTVSSRPRDKNDADGEEDASCCLVKTLKDLNL